MRAFVYNFVILSIVFLIRISFFSLYNSSRDFLRLIISRHMKEIIIKSDAITAASKMMC